MANAARTVTENVCHLVVGPVSQIMLCVRKSLTPLIQINVFNRCPCVSFLAS